MPGEGLGGRLTDEAARQIAGNYPDEDETYDVVSIGEYVIDNVAVAAEDSELADRMEDWEDEDWFPRAGESLEVPAVPDEVDDYMEEQFPGGKAPNQAAAAGMSGADTLFYGAVGEADAMLDDLYAKGTDVRLDRDPDGTSAQTYIFVEEEGENRISCVKDEDGLLDEDFVDEAYDAVMDAEYLLATNGMLSEPLEYMLSELSDEPEDERPTVIFDPSPIEDAGRMLGYDAVDIATPNEVEYDLLEEELEDSDATVIQTRSDGAMIDGEYAARSPDVDVYDTTGAGDTFNGYLAGRLSQGDELEEAVEYAVHAASLSVEREGAMPSIPGDEEVEERWGL